MYVPRMLPSEEKGFLEQEAASDAHEEGRMQDDPGNGRGRRDARMGRP
jgi:hypothetical protein